MRAPPGRPGTKEGAPGAALGASSPAGRMAPQSPGPRVWLLCLRPSYLSRPAEDSRPGPLGSGNRGLGPSEPPGRGGRTRQRRGRVCGAPLPGGGARGRRAGYRPRATPHTQWSDEPRGKGGAGGGPLWPPGARPGVPGDAPLRGPAPQPSPDGTPSAEVLRVPATSGLRTVTRQAVPG